MAIPRIFLFAGAICALLLFVAAAPEAVVTEDELSILNAGDPFEGEDGGDGPQEFELGPDETGSFGAAGDFDGFGEDDDFSDLSEPSFDESDVVVLTDGNFTEFVQRKRYVLVEFYAPWCGHCKALAPEYAAAATELKGEDGLALAKIDATEETNAAQKYEIQGFPSLFFFIDGVHKEYTGGRSKEAIVTWIKKKLGPGSKTITTPDEAEEILTAESRLVLAYLESLTGPESTEFAAASKLDDEVNFYHTVNADVAKLFHIDPKKKRPSLVLLKKEDEKLTYFEGEFKTSKIAEFVAANKLPLVTVLSRETAPSVFENPIKKQLILFTVANDTETYVPIFREAAKSFKGKAIFVYVERDNEDVGEPVSNYFGVTGYEPTVMAYTGNEDAKKFFLEGAKSLQNIKKFVADFLEDKLTPFYKSEPIPETNDGYVKVVVGKSFDDIVLDESKDVLLELYAPWCGHCQALEPIYNKLAKQLWGIESLVIAKMDGTANEHPRAKSDGFPTILFFPAGSKSFEPITYDGERTVVDFYKFLKKNAAVPFKLQKSATGGASSGSSSTEDSSAKSEYTSSSGDADSGLKDEL